MDVTIQVDDALFARFNQACEETGVFAVDYIELCVSEIIKANIEDMAAAPNINDPRCRINKDDDPTLGHGEED
ncbi:MAG TPA: hypothetical protein VKM55_01090 [Candidatus Lokiarchaeia archaeon]|nr:hypothetical protein [Candidatus Lokiarchaeia archaeon]